MTRPARDAGGRVRVINEREAVVVRQIFDLYLAGHGVRGISKLLNEQHAPCPRPQQGRAAGWSPATVWAALKREDYHGQVVSNRTKKRNRWGQKRPTARPEGEWIRVTVPQLRIVEEELWLVVQTRREGGPAVLSLDNGRQAARATGRTRASPSTC